MNIVGKVFLWICVVMILVAIYMTTMLLDIRQKWLTEVDQRLDQVEKGIVDVRDARRRVRAAEELRQQMVHDWGDIWTAQGRMQPGGTGAMEVAVGTNAGLPQKAEGAQGDPAVYVFAENGDQSQYLGEFRVTAIRPDRAVLQRSRPPTPEEVAQWPQAANVHIRGTLPQNWLTLSADIDANQIVARSNLETQQMQLNILNQQIQSSQAALDARLAELNGNANAPADASETVKNGLVQTLRNAGSRRNEQLLRVDQVRHQLDATYVTLMQTLQSNRQSAESLEQSKQNEAPSSETTARPAADPVLSIGSAERP